MDPKLKPAGQVPIAVYVAGASARKERAAAFINRVNEHPLLTVTHDWTAFVQAGADARLRDADRAKEVGDCIAAIFSADVMVYLAEVDAVSRGAPAELGIAITLRILSKRARPRLIISGGARNTIFTTDFWPVMPGVEELGGWRRLPLADIELEHGHEDNDDQAFDRLVEYAAHLIEHRERVARSVPF